MNKSDRVSADSLPSARHHMLGSQAYRACFFVHQEEFEFAEISFQIDAGEITLSTNENNAMTRGANQNTNSI